MGRTLDPAMATSSSDDELVSRFSGFFSEKIIRIRSEIDASVVNKELSKDFPLSFTRSFTSHFRSVTEADVLRYIRETRKTCCSLDPINVPVTPQIRLRNFPRPWHLLQGLLHRQLHR